MTDNEIIKTLEHCVNEEQCNGCPYWEDDTCLKGEFKDILDLINRLQAENEDARNGVKSFRSKYKNALQVVREKQSIIESFTDIGKMYSEIKAEAINSLIDRLEIDYTFEIQRGDGYWEKVVRLESIKAIVKEMVGEE